MTVGPENWSRVQQIFHAALERRGEARHAYMAAACADDQELRAHVEALLASHDSARRSDEPSPATVENITSQEEDLTGRTAGVYRVVSRIGSGGMGDVYLAHDAKLDR